MTLYMSSTVPSEPIKSSSIQTHLSPSPLPPSSLSSQSQDQALHLPQQHDPLCHSVGLSDQPGTEVWSGWPSEAWLLLPPLQQSQIPEVGDLSPSLPPSLSLFLTHTHTHTHSLPLSLPLSHSLPPPSLPECLNTSLPRCYVLHSMR